MAKWSRPLENDASKLQKTKNEQHNLLVSCNVYFKFQITTLNINRITSTINQLCAKTYKILRDIKITTNTSWNLSEYLEIFKYVISFIYKMMETTIVNERLNIIG